MESETTSLVERQALVRQVYLGSLGFLHSASVVMIFSFLIAFSKEFLRASLHIPGHSGAYVIPLLLVGRIASRSRVGGIGIGGLSGFVMAYLGLGGGYLLGVPRYLFMGIVVDIFMLNPAVHERGVSLVAAGIFANFAKFFVGLLIATFLGLPVFFIQIGLTYSAFTHLLFGGLGGFAAFLVLKAVKRHSFRG